MSEKPRNESGRFVSPRCDDPNCDGSLTYQPERDGRFETDYWLCDGLTHDTDNGPLRACARSVIGPSRLIGVTQP